MKENYHLKIYASSEERFSEWQGPSYKPLKIERDLNQCLLQPFKVIIVDAFCDNQHNRFVYAHNPIFVDFDWQQIDLVVIKETLWSSYEFIYKEFIQKNKIKKHIVSSHDPTNEFNLFNPYWLLRPVNYGRIQEENNQQKKYLFDVLLGYPRPHRFFVLGKLLQNKNLLDSSVVTFRSEFLFDGETVDSMWATIDPYIKDLFGGVLTYPYVSSTMDDSWENVSGQDLNRRYFLDGIDIPCKIYENTWYSICTETNDENSFRDSEIPRITEKTARLFLAKRVFVMFGCRGNLQLLKSLGFKTFDCIIDESYDLEVNPICRFEKAFAQVIKLAELDPAEVYKITEGIREHNFQRIYTLRDELRDKANELLVSMIPSEFCS
jgi:hypothetical protein